MFRFIVYIYPKQLDSRKKNKENLQEIKQIIRNWVLSSVLY